MDSPDEFVLSLDYEDVDLEDDVCVQPDNDSEVSKKKQRGSGGGKKPVFKDVPHAIKGLKMACGAGTFPLVCCYYNSLLGMWDARGIHQFSSTS